MELLFLLLPVAAISGWWSGRRSLRQGREKGQERISSPAYFRGLNLLLNEQPDKAIEVFVQLLEVDSETVETHLALGNLFRRRGEVDRAIRIHQNLIARPTLTRPQRTQALLELGQDYMSAGLYDRAEGLFNELLNMRSHQQQALRHLHQIYQLERDWDKCLLTLRTLESLGEPPMQLERAHYHCELGLQAHREGQEGQAEAMFKKALSVDKGCVRASMLLGELAMGRAAFDEAISHFSRVEAQNPVYFGEVVDVLREACDKAGKQGVLRRMLQHNAEQHGNVQAMMALADLLQQEEGDEAATTFIYHFLSRHPSTRGLDHLLALRLRSASAEVVPLLTLLQGVVGRMLESNYPYRCGQCGFLSRRLYWQCPGCKGWSTILPQQLGELIKPKRVEK